MNMSDLKNMKPEDLLDSFQPELLELYRRQAMEEALAEVRRETASRTEWLELKCELELNYVLDQIKERMVAGEATSYYLYERLAKAQAKLKAVTALRVVMN